ncbi:Protein of uncharacterised function (DUF402) [Metamycoplasma arthritidis]|uniref:RNAse G and E associated domain containing protein n=1 Tax=Metamycoplasma arthritidis (strain 158L3-1) TaxID=243272 RepID=B3PLY7_META1|nr:DUF402 domain-containing protein [Metamycoplasma arthritidis]ACF07039.1 RNAse G and E associated domain containing protein [Metamycoplasma arthritidis 158L3-1]VEU78569.1 Protein of uncharacterised function (DUF402) [Metamycoplasma arthritidis]
MTNNKNEEPIIKSFYDLLNDEEKEKQPVNTPRTGRHLFDIGEIINIQAFKYDGTLYRQYEGAKVIANLNDFVVLLLIKTKVSEENMNWIVSDPTLFFFAKNKFYNANITLNRNKENYIYVNLASPFYIDNGTVKYIDFDVDVKSYAAQEFNVIDWNDFKESIKKLNYPLELIYRIYDELDYLYEQFKNKNGVFSSKLVDGLAKMLRESGDI